MKVELALSDFKCCIFLKMFKRNFLKHPLLCHLFVFDVMVDFMSFVVKFDSDYAIL